MRKLLPYLLAVFFVASCSSSEEEPTPTPPPTPEKSIALVTTSATPGQIVIAQADSKPTITPNTKLKVGGKEVLAIAGDSNKVMFILPVFAPGKVTVDFSSVGINKQLDLTVSPYTAITNPASVALSFTTEISQIANKFQAHVDDPIIKLDPAYIAVLNQQKQAIEENFSKLSPEEQLEVAYTLRSIMPNDEDFILDKPNPNNHRRSGSDPGEELYTTGLKFKTNVTRSVALLATGTALMLLPDPTLASKVLATAALTGGLVYLMDAKAQAAEIGSLKGVAEKILEDFSDAKLGTFEAVASARRAGEIEFIKGKTKKLTLSGEYRTLIQADKASTASLIADIFKYMEKFQEQYNAAVTLANKVKSWFFGSGPTIPAYQSSIGTQATKKPIALPTSKIAIKNISDPAVQVTSTANSAGGFDVTASSTNTSLQNKPFTFDIVFTDTRTGVTLTKKINALYKPIQPNTVSIIDGNNQIGEPGKALPKPLQVKVVDAEGKPLENIEVEWTIKSGGGSLSSSKTVTNAQGIAQVTWTMKADATGEQKVEALVKKGDGTVVTNSPSQFIAHITSIVGQWTLVKEFFEDNSTAGHWTNGKPGENFKFESNGKTTLTEMRSDGSLKVSNGTYVLDKSKMELTITWVSSSGDTDTELYTIKTFTSTDLVINYRDYDSPTSYVIIEYVLKKQ